MSKKRVGITGQNGFIGQALFNFIGLYPNDFEIIQFEREFFEDEDKLIKFVGNCDVIVHLAALNRHEDSNVIYNTNILLIQKLIFSLEKSKSKAHVFFSSSIQEERDNLFGRSKKEGRLLLSNWAKKSGALFTGMIIPNVYGPFGIPYYNSFIATFSHQLTHDEDCIIEVDGQVKLIYVFELVKIIINQIFLNEGKSSLKISHTSKYKVSEILSILTSYRDIYFKHGIIPKLNSPFEINLFNSFRSYIDLKKYFPIKLDINKDFRGSFVEVIKLNSGGQVSFSTTASGVTRGNHYHTRKIERFSVIRGEALIQMRKVNSSEVIDFYLDGNGSSYVDIPIWYIHNITNIGDDILYTIFWINEFYLENDPDTYYEKV
jgi:UDP-2-acetamido-2,6-beta-L-arabino-hexul-4-ose reductase